MMSIPKHEKYSVAIVGNNRILAFYSKEKNGHVDDYWFITKLKIICLCMTTLLASNDN